MYLTVQSQEPKMPALVVRESSEVPAPRKTSSASLEQQRLYESFIRDVGTSNVGELELSENEAARSVKVRLTRAAKRLGTELQMWDTDGKVYFKSTTAAPRRGRPPKNA